MGDPATIAAVFGVVSGVAGVGSTIAGLSKKKPPSGSALSLPPLTANADLPIPQGVNSNQSFNLGNFGSQLGQGMNSQSPNLLDTLKVFGGTGIGG